MKLNKRILIPIIIVIVVIVVVIAFYVNLKKIEEDENNLIENHINNNAKEEIVNETEQNIINENNTEQENERISSVKEQYGFTGDNELYEESNNELLIKPSIAYRTGLIGSLEQRMPTYTEINNQNVVGEPNDAGIWISPSSRNIFLSCINSVENSYEIDENGYLKVKSEANSQYADKIDEIKQQNKLVIVDMTGINYMVDVVTGDIIKNEFEAMDPYQVYEYAEYEDANKSIIFLNSNEKNKLTNQEIVETMMNVI